MHHERTFVPRYSVARRLGTVGRTCVWFALRSAAVLGAAAAAVLGTAVALVALAAVVRQHHAERSVEVSQAVLLSRWPRLLLWPASNLWSVRSSLDSKGT